MYSNSTSLTKHNFIEIEIEIGQSTQNRILTSESASFTYSSCLLFGCRGMYCIVLYVLRLTGKVGKISKKKINEREKKKKKKKEDKIIRFNLAFFFWPEEVSTYLPTAMLTKGSRW